MKSVLKVLSVVAVGAMVFSGTAMASGAVLCDAGMFTGGATSGYPLNSIGFGNCTGNQKWATGSFLCGQGSVTVSSGDSNSIPFAQFTDPAKGTLQDPVTCVANISLGAGDVYALNPQEQALTIAYNGNTVTVKNPPVSNATSEVWVFDNLNDCSAYLKVRQLPQYGCTQMGNGYGVAILPSK